MRGKKRPAALSKMGPAIAKKHFKLLFFLLSRAVERTPSPTEELQLLQAGLGKRTITIAEDADYEEVCRHVYIHGPVAI